jgi:membrane protease YdiL (CAAX protease family)
MTSRPSPRAPVLTFFAVTALATALFWTAKAVPFLQHNLQAAIAVLFFYAPVVAGRLSKEPFDFHAAGLTLQPMGRNALVFAGAIAVTFPLFIAGFFAFYGAVCGANAHALPAGLSRLCPSGGWTGLMGGHLRLPTNFWLLAANQVLVVALPEEVFFRGYLLQRLEATWPPTRRLLGARVGGALLLASVLFALGHLLVDFNPQRLAVFFPGLAFGWMRARTGSLAAGTAFHASCNLLSEILHVSFFG